MENLITILITLAIVAYSAYRKSKRQGQNEPLPPDASWESDEVETDEVEEAPQVPDSLQDLVRKFKEEQAKVSRGDTVPQTAPHKKIVKAEQKTFEHQAKHIEPAVPKVSSSSKYVPKKDFIRNHASEIEEAKSVFAQPKATEVQSPILEIAPSDLPLKRKPAMELNIKEARKGFLWAKVLDDPRFKRRSPYPFS